MPKWPVLRPDCSVALACNLQYSMYTRLRGIFFRHCLYIRALACDHTRSWTVMSATWERPMSDLMYFDYHAVIGQRSRKHRRERRTTEHLLEDIDVAEVAGALTVHAVVTTYDPIYGNHCLGLD